MARRDFHGRPLQHWPYHTYNWGRWENGRGTLNLADKAATQRGLQAVQEHQTITLGAKLRDDNVLHETDYACDFSLTLLRAGKYAFGPADEPVLESGDRFSVAVHGMINTHIDAFCHVGHHGRSFNGDLFQDVVSLGGGVRKYDVTALGGLVTRAWFIDVPAQRGITHLNPGDPVTPDDLKSYDQDVLPGDALIIRTGRFAAQLISPDSAEARDDHGNWSGLHVDCIDSLAQWDVATVATDGPGDNFPSSSEHCSVPIHVLSEVYLGLPLIHHLELEEFSATMSSRPSKALLFVVAPLQIDGGTGSPVSPLAVL